MFLAPVLVGDVGSNGSTSYLFAATSVVVGLREELAYRGILQRILAQRPGVVDGLLMSNVGFVLYHRGVQPFTLLYVFQIFLCGMMLGFVYRISGGIKLVVSLHAVYDAIDSSSPYFRPRLPDLVSTLVLSLTLVAATAERARDNREAEGH
ncbi:MAG: CPBP family intramembrane metalloprotease [Undibacterium sp.]|nr:CPBP family intramembrane metalloprotease [Opitutaceae bacterium]